ncbi:MAG: MarR family transcriptional regulator [Cytophagales bacterium]|nr:MAG: MarR family transcriptional regulator [Cytophagales bacterium]
MKIEEELKTHNFQSNTQKAHLNILFTAEWIQARIHKILKPFGLSNEQYNVLRILKGQHPQSLCTMEVAERMINKNSNITRIAYKLVQKGLIQKQQSTIDRREWELSITEKGLEMLQQIETNLSEAKLHQSPLLEVEAAQINLLLDKMREEGQNTTD